MNEKQETVLFAGGGTGGHIFPNLAVIERLRELRPGVEPHLVISHRPLDRQIAEAEGLGYTVAAAEPLRKGPGGVVKFVLGYQRTVRQVRELVGERAVRAVVSTGGFVGGPTVAGAKAAGAKAALVNLDAVPGRANRVSAKRADALFTAYEDPALNGAARVGLPMRKAARSEASTGEARRKLGLEPGRETLLVTAGSQGAQTINAMMIAACADARLREALGAWQVLHLSGAQLEGELEQAYAEAGVRAKVMRFCEEMGLAWSAASLAISRAGAGSVAESWAGAVPTLFFPYPYHKDGHQRWNAEPMVATGGAMLLEDRIEAGANVAQLAECLPGLMGGAERRRAMREALEAHALPDGAEAVARWVEGEVGV